MSMDGTMNANHAGPPGGAATSPPGGNHTQVPPGATTVDQRKFDVEYQTQTLNAYIYDYLRKQNLNQTATCLLNEGSFPANPVVIENRDGGLLEWWLSLFWDAYLQRLLQKPEGPPAPGAAPQPPVGAAPGPGAQPAAAMAPAPVAAAAAAAAEGKGRGPRAPPAPADVKPKPDGAGMGPAAPAAAYVAPTYKTVARAAPSAQSMYLVPGWAPTYGAAPGPGGDYGRGVGAGGFPPSSPDVSAAAPSPIASMTPRSPQSTEGVEEESKKRSKGGRRRSTVAVLPPDGGPPTQAGGGTARGDQNAVPLPYANAAYRPADNGALLSASKPLFYPQQVAYAPPRQPSAMPKGAPAAPAAAGNPPALFFTGVTYPPPPRAYAAAALPSQQPPSAPPMYASAGRTAYGTDGGRVAAGQWKAEESAATAKRKGPEPDSAPAPAPTQPNGPPAAAGGGVRSSSGGMGGGGAQGGQVPGGARPMWPYYNMTAPGMDGRAHSAGASAALAYGAPPPPQQQQHAAFAPYAAPHWTLEPSVGGGVGDDAGGYAAPPLAASTSAEFYSTLGTLFPDDDQGQGQGGAGAGAHNGGAGVGGDADGSLASSAAAVDPDAFLAGGGADDPQNN